MISVVRRKVLADIFKPQPVVTRLFCDKDVKAKPFESIPGPMSFPGIGTMLHYLPFFGPYDFKRLPETYAKMHKQYGDLVREKCTPTRCIVHVYSPEDMYKVYRSDGEMPRRLSHTALAKYRRMRPELYSGPGLLPTNGEEWANFRNIFKRAILSITTVYDLAPNFERVIDDLIEVIPDYLDEFNETDLTPLLYRWGLESVAFITMGVRLGCLSKEGNPNAERLIKAAEDTHVAVYKTEHVPSNYEKNYKLLERAQDIFGPFVKGLMDTFLADETWPEKNCLLSKLLQCEGATEKKAFTMLIDMFLAGIDSSSFTLSFALYNLAENQAVQEKLRTEVMGYLPTLQDKMAGTKMRTKYLNAVLNESLRVNPVAIGNGRLLNKDLVLSGYHVPKDTMVILQHQTASKSERYFKNANLFKPERWIESNERSVAFSPFGFGYRTCVGKILAEKQLRLAIAKFVRNFEISYHHAPIGSKTILLNFPDKPLRLRLRKINN